MPAQNVAAGSSVTGYAISRDASGNFVANVAATWSYGLSTGGVVAGDLVPSLDTMSAVFTGHAAGSATIRAVGAFTGNSGTITVTAGTATQVRVETLANGSGTVVPAQSLASGSSLTGFAISRDASGNFVANVAADTWSLQGITGGVVAGDLVPSGDAKSAVFTGHVAGSATIRAVGAFTGNSGTITVTAATATQVRVETAADGSGIVVPAQSLASGSALTVYAISRDASNNFVANVAATWSLQGITGPGVVAGDPPRAPQTSPPRPRADTEERGLPGHVAGSGTIDAFVSGLTSIDSGLVTVTAAPSLSLVKQVGASATGPWSASITVAGGSPVYYEFTITNTGNTPLSPVSVTDLTVSTASCTWPSSLAAGANVSCVVGPIAAAMLAGTYTNIATAHGTYNSVVYDSTPSLASYTVSAAPR